MFQGRSNEETRTTLRRSGAPTLRLRHASCQRDILHPLAATFGHLWILFVGMISNDVAHINQRTSR